MSDKLSREDKALQKFMQEWNQLLTDGQFDQVNQILSELDIKNTITTVLLWAVIITRFAKERLPHREQFLKDVQIEFINRLGPDRANKLLNHRR